MTRPPYFNSPNFLVNLYFSIRKRYFISVYFHYNMLLLFHSYLLSHFTRLFIFRLSLGTVRPLYRTGVSLLFRESFLYISSTNMFHYLIFA